MDCAKRQELLDVVGAALEDNPHAIAFLVERELLADFNGRIIGTDPNRREELLLEIRRTAERIGIPVKSVYFDPDNPNAILIEQPAKIMPPV